MTEREVNRKTDHMRKDFFEGKVAVITGSTRGIGKGIAAELAKRGASIVLNGRNSNRLKEAGKEISRIHERVVTVCSDVSTVEGAAFLINEAVRSFGRIDILVNNAGISMQGFVADLNPAVFKTVFDLNVIGVSNTTIPALKYLRETHGSVIFISSAAGIRGLPGFSAYSSSKMALRAIAESIKVEEAKYKVHAGLIIVGFTQNEADKETLAADGSMVPLKSRSIKGVQPISTVAKAVVKNITRRKFITVLSPIGKLNFYMQSYCPSLVDFVIRKNIKNFEKRSS